MSGRQKGTHSGEWGQRGSEWEAEGYTLIGLATGRLCEKTVESTLTGVGTGKLCEWKTEVFSLIREVTGRLCEWETEG